MTDLMVLVVKGDKVPKPTEISQALRRVAASIDRGERNGKITSLHDDPMGSWYFTEWMP